MKITLAVLTYNQEQHIKKAIAGAFEQDYSPMEIIISDDCSTDATYEVCKSAICCYQGQNKVILNRNNRNLGIGGHVKRIGNIASGDIIIMAAGDDVSMPNRVSETVKAFRKNPHACAVFSDEYRIGDDDSLLDQTQRWRRYLDRPISRTEIVKRGGGVGIGATYAYKRKCFFWPWNYPDFYQIEDCLLPLRASLIGDVIYIPEALVKYRVSLMSFSRRKSPVDIFARYNVKYQQEIFSTIQYAMKQRLLGEREGRNLLRLANGNAKTWQRHYKLINSGKFLSRLQAKIMLIFFHREIPLQQLVKKIISIRRKK